MTQRVTEGGWVEMVFGKIPFEHPLFYWGLPLVTFAVCWTAKKEKFRPNINQHNITEGGVSALLYVGLGLVSVGMVITFVGLGDKVIQKTATN